MIQEELFLSSLIQKGLIKQTDAYTLLQEAKSLEKRVEDVIYEKNLVDEKKLSQIKSELFKLPVKIFSKTEIIPQNVLNLIPEDTARHYGFIAFNKEGNILDVGMVYPDDSKSQEAVKFITERLDLKLKVSIIIPSDFKNILKQYQTFAKEFDELLQDFQKRFSDVKKRNHLLH